MPVRIRSRLSSLIWSAGLTTLALEAATLLARVLSCKSAAEFNQSVDPPLIVKMHHMFWAAPVALVALAVHRSRATLSAVLWGVAVGLVASDLLHHFVVLPLWVGNTGWHWP